MVDQVRNLRKSGVQAVISCNLRGSSVVGKNPLLLRIALQVLVISPEALDHTKKKEDVENPLMFSRVCSVVIDEAYCVKWLVLYEEYTITFVIVR